MAGVEGARAGSIWRNSLVHGGLRPDYGADPPYEWLAVAWDGGVGRTSPNPALCS